MSMHPDYLDGMRAFDRGEPLDPAQRSQWRRGWSRARANAADKARAMLQQMRNDTVRASEREELGVLMDLGDVALVDVMTQPPEWLEAMGFTYLAAYRK